MLPCRKPKLLLCCQGSRIALLHAYTLMLILLPPLLLRTGWACAGVHAAEAAV